MADLRAHNGINAPSSAYEMARSLAAVKAIQAGELVVPLRCGFCKSPSVTPDPIEGLVCVQCGRGTTHETAHRLRKQELRAVIAEGIDPRRRPRVAA